MELPNIGDVVRLYPAPLLDAEVKPGKPLPLRRVQDGAGNYRRFLPDEGAERPFDFWWHDRLLSGDVLLVDPQLGYARAAAPAPGEPPQEATPTAAPVAPRSKGAPAKP